VGGLQTVSSCRLAAASDFLSRTSPKRAAGLARRGGAVVLLQVLDREELSPPDEDAELSDPEVPSRPPIRVGVGTVPSYQRAFARHSAALARLARSRGWRRSTLLADELPARWLAAWLAAGLVALRAS
jgi:hypothetical protein